MEGALQLVQEPLYHERRLAGRAAELSEAKDPAEVLGAGGVSDRHQSPQKVLAHLVAERAAVHVENRTLSCVARVEARGRGGPNSVCVASSTD